MADPLDQARGVADAVLYEGYVLYPYRADDTKNRMRFQWGVLCPPGAEDDGSGEGPAMRTELPVRTRGTTSVRVVVRHLQVQERVVERVEDHEVTALPAATVDGRDVVTWTEAVEHEHDLGVFDLAELASGPRRLALTVDGDTQVEAVGTADDGARIRLRRTRWPLQAEVELTAGAGDDAVAGPAVGDVVRVAVSVTNTASWEGGSRDVALRTSLVAAHTLLEVRDGVPCSVMAPPEDAAAVAASCANERTFPVLVGDATDPVVLSSPIILYDFPTIAAESPGAFFDATEIDELLALRVMTLTDDEKQRARATDERAAAIVDLADGLTAADRSRLHGAIRTFDRDPDTPWWDPAGDDSVDPDTDAVEVAGARVARGSRVLLRPGRRADAQDQFLADRRATVQAVLFDVDGSTHLAVTIDDDPGADLRAEFGRFHYFHPDEVVPLGGDDTTED